MRKILIAVLLWTMIFVAQAGSGPRAVRKTIEASMRVTGEIVVTHEGKVASYVLDQADTMPREAKQLLARFVPQAEFEVRNSSGKPGSTTLKMSVQLLAQPRPEGGAVIKVADTYFYPADKDPSSAAVSGITRLQMKPPTYPINAAAAGVSGTVYVIVRINPDGSVGDVHAERVDMQVIAGERELELWRGVLAKSALAASKKWTFTLSPERLAMPGNINVRVPVSYLMWGRDKPAKDGLWQSYVPGSYHPVPWEKNIAEEGIGAMAPGQLYPIGGGVRMRNAGI